MLVASNNNYNLTSLNILSTSSLKNNVINYLTIYFLVIQETLKWF